MTGFSGLLPGLCPTGVQYYRRQLRAAAQDGHLAGGPHRGAGPPRGRPGALPWKGLAGRRPLWPLASQVQYPKILRLGEIAYQRLAPSNRPGPFMTSRPDFWNAFLSGVAGPASLYPPPPRYWACIPRITVAQTFAQVGFSITSASLSSEFEFYDQCLYGGSQVKIPCGPPIV
jgi:hypothetical protein